MVKRIKALYIIATASAIGMFIVLLSGATVTKTESGRGCGDSWPLCHGTFVPSYTIETLFEYSHRIVSAIEGLLVLLTFVLVFIFLRRLDARAYAAGALFFTILQAILGALAVVRPPSSWVMALHFGFSLLAFAFTLLLALLVREIYKGREPTHSSGVKLDGSVPTRRMTLTIWSMMVYTYVVVFLGAFVRHTDSGGGCLGWPTCNGELIPDLSGASGIVYLHRVAAFIFLLIVGLLWFWMQRSEKMAGNLQRIGTWVFGLAIVQIASGAVVVWTIGSDNYLFSSMLHTVLIAILFGVICYLGVRVLQIRRVYKRHLTNADHRT